MKLIYYLLFVLTTAIVLSCSQTAEEIEKEFINSKIDTFEHIGDEQWMVVLPGLGCKGCIQEGEAFMVNHINNKKIKFVLTRVESIKLLEQKTGVKIKEHNNIFIDRENYFELSNNNSIYPLIIELKEKKMSKYEFQSPANGMAFERLSDRLAMN